MTASQSIPPRRAAPAPGGTLFLFPIPTLPGYADRVIYSGGETEGVLNAEKSGCKRKVSGN